MPTCNLCWLWFNFTKIACVPEQRWLKCIILYSFSSTVEYFECRKINTIYIHIYSIGSNVKHCKHCSLRNIYEYYLNHYSYRGKHGLETTVSIYGRKHLRYESHLDFLNKCYKDSVIKKIKGAKILNLE